jgi:hypothetical protein
MTQTHQPSLLADVQRAERPWKVSRRTSRAAFYEAELTGRLRDRERIVGTALRGLWNRSQRSARSSQIARWIRRRGKAWIGREWSWVLLETRRALTGLREKGLADTKDDGGKELLWRWREQGVGEREANRRSV